MCEKQSAFYAFSTLTCAVCCGLTHRRQQQSLRSAIIIHGVCVCVSVCVWVSVYVCDGFVSVWQKESEYK